jgi:exo-1,4-beta-D-glucosaminidase
MLKTVNASALVLCLLAASATAAHAAPEPPLVLRGNWAIQSATDVRETGGAISTPAFTPANWYRTTVPTTVLAALVRLRVYPDPAFGMNLRGIPGTSYPVGTNFSNIPTPPESPFRHAWWYRTEFDLPADAQGKTVRLHFDGINYRANVWLNGRQVASSDETAGSWRLFVFDVTGTARPGAKNVLAVEVFPPQPDDLAITFVDWNPQPPDRNMGLWREVYLTATGPVSMAFPHVITRLNLPAADSAALTVTGELTNARREPVEGVLRGRIEDVAFEQPVRLEAGETRVIRFTPDAFPMLRIANPRLWWPAQLGAQNLYPLRLEFVAGGAVSDAREIQFGIRDVTSVVDDKQHRLFRINGRNILIRGAGYTFDMLLRSTPERQEAELDYVRDMNLNAIRLEGKLEDDHFFDLCDRKGILVMAGWCCCDHWERWRNWKGEDHAVAGASLRDQIRRLRSHPSVFDWLNGSDNPPPAEVEKQYVAILKECDWPNPYQSSATQKPTDVTGATGLKMTGPYEFVVPSYWLSDTTRGGAHGFNTETGPGPAVPPVESLRQMLPGDHLWPIDTFWDFHAGGGAFKDLKVFTEALTRRYGAATGVEDYARKAQVMAYEGHRAMFEAFGRNKYTSTGVIQWMLNNAWPSMIWHLYDYYLRPGGSYFGAKKACEPLHVQFSYDDRSVVVVNSYYRAFPRMKVKARLLNLDLKEMFAREATIDVGEDSAARVFTVPEPAGLSTTYFVELGLADPSGKPVSRNFYWLSTKPETPDWDRSNWYYTPTKSFADLKGLATLAPSRVSVAASGEQRGDAGTARVRVENPGRTLAFGVHLKLVKSQPGEGDGADDGTIEATEVLPVLWEDNYFPLMPGASRELTVTWRARDAAKATLAVVVDGWNVPRASAPVKLR